MANIFGNIAGLGVAAYIGQQRRKNDHELINKERLKLGLPALEYEEAPIDKAFDWVGDKVKSWTTTDTPVAPDAPTTPAVGTPSVGGGDDVGLWERLKAGNIDQEGSEAYNRWGKGKQLADQRVAGLEESSRLEAQNNLTDAPVEFTKEQFDNAPDPQVIAEQKWTDAMKPTEGFLDNQ